MKNYPTAFLQVTIKVIKITLKVVTEEMAIKKQECNESLAVTIPPLCE